MRYSKISKRRGGWGWGWRRVGYEISTEWGLVGGWLSKMENAWFFYCLEYKTDRAYTISKTKRFNSIVSLSFPDYWRRGVVVINMISLNKTSTQVLRRFKSCSQRVGDSRWWESPTMVPAGNKADCLSSVNHTTKTIHQHSSLLFLFYNVGFWTVSVVRK